MKERSGGSKKKVPETEPAPALSAVLLLGPPPARTTKTVVVDATFYEALNPIPDGEENEQTNEQDENESKRTEEESESSSQILGFDYKFDNTRF
uniref:Uncharacterized protein n=2 Tax=Arabidopsis thaliana TaxID=3702 RepID=Q1G3Z8_ARATH|nr:hypothetical protein At1g36395 [Arabidopsis thaliana]